jgi:hypothetical protein
MKANRLWLKAKPKQNGMSESKMKANQSPGTQTGRKSNCQIAN